MKFQIIQLKIHKRNEMLNIITINKSFLKRFWILTLFCLSIISTAFSTIDSSKWIEKERSKVNNLIFENGLTLLHYEKTDTPEVVLFMNIKVGSKDETPTQAGFAHLLEHMVFKGTDDGKKSLSETDAEAIAAKYCVGNIGEGFNAFTSYDNTCYLFNTDKNNWPVFLRIFKGWLLNAKLDPQHFASEIKTVYEELKDRGHNPISKGLSMTVPPIHPYFNSVIGYKETLLKSSVEDLKDFYKQHYSPQKTAIIAVGNIKKEDLVKHITKYFKTKLVSENINITKNNENTPFYSGFYQDSFTFYNPEPYSTTYLIWPLPGINKINEHALIIASYLLSERLNRKLKDELQYVSYITAGATNFALQNVLSIQYEVKSNKEVELGNIKEECKKIILDEINKIRRDGFDEKELEICKKGIMHSCLSKFENLSAICFELQEIHQRNLPIEFAFSHPDKFANLSLEDLKGIICEYIRPIKMQTIESVQIPSDELKNWEKEQEVTDSYDKVLLSNFKRETPIEKPSYVHKLPAPKLLDFDFSEPTKILTLSNGMKVFLKKRDNVPFISLRLGTFDNTHISRNLAIQNKDIIYSLASNQLICGSKDYSKKENEDFFDEHGVMGSPIAFYCLKTNFETVAKRCVEIILNPTYPEQYLTESISSSLDSISKNLETPWGIAGEIFTEIFHKQYPWTKTRQETFEVLSNSKKEDIIAMHKNFISSTDKIFIVVVGDYNEDTIESSLEKIFEDWKKGKLSLDDTKIEIPEISNPIAQTITKYVPSERVALMIGKITTNPHSREWFSLLIIEHLLNKKLFNIREKRGIFYSCSASLANRSSVELKDYGAIYAQVSAQNLNIAKIEIANALQSFIDNEIIEEELITTKQNFLTELAKSFTKNAEIAKSYTSILEEGKEWDCYKEFLKNIHSITREEVKEVAAKYLNPKDWTTIQVGRIKQS